jgi:hypothetical protein
MRHRWFSRRRGRDGAGQQHVRTVALHSRRWAAPTLVLVLLAVPVSARAQEVLTETEKTAALKFANADGTVSSLEAQHSISALAAAEQISGETQPSTSALANGLGPNAQAMASTPVDVVVLHGHFVEWDFPTPQGSPTPEGTVLELVINRLTGGVVASRLADTTTTLASVDVQSESFKPSVAQIARLRHLRARARQTQTQDRHAAHAAEWSEEHCGDTELIHCYAETSWQMSGGGHEVEGSEFKVLLREGGVPSGGEAFVDEEEWVGADFEAPGGWAEAGVISSLENPRGLYWFWAYKDSGGTLVKFLGSPYTGEVNVGEFVNLALMASGSHVWCLKIGPNWETQAWCMNTGFTYSTRLTDGSEMATNTKPEVAGTAESNYESLNGELRNWNEATDLSTTENGKDHVSEVCEWNIGPAGDINDGTC